MDEPHGKPETLELARLYRELQSPGSERCPEADALATLVLGDVPSQTRESISDHVVSCRRCSEDYQILARTHAQAAPASRRFAAKGWVAAAVIACALAAGVWVARQDHARTEAVRGSSFSIGSLLVPPDGAELRVPPTEFRWPAQDRAEGYRLQLFSSTGEKLWESDLSSQPRRQLPALVDLKLHGGRSYFWTVVVEGPLGNRRLGPYTFALR